MTSVDLILLDTFLCVLIKALIAEIFKTLTSFALNELLKQYGYAIYLSSKGANFRLF